MSGVRWRGLSHEEIYASVWNGPGPEGSADAQVIWNQVSVRLREIDGMLATEMARIAGGWEGAAASAASGALTPLGNWTSDATGDALLTANGLTGQAEQVAWVRGNLPPPAAPGLPEEPPSGLNDPGLDPYFLADWHEADAIRNEAAAQAVHVMETYQGNAGTNQGNLYYWTPPPAVTAEVPPPAAPSPGGGVGGIGAGGARRGSNARSGRGGDRTRTALRGDCHGAPRRRRSRARRRRGTVARRRYRWGRRSTQHTQRTHRTRRRPDPRAARRPSSRSRRACRVRADRRPAGARTRRSAVPARTPSVRGPRHWAARGEAPLPGRRSNPVLPDAPPPSNDRPSRAGRRRRGRASATPA